jgi:hypothetical protein
MRAIISHHRHCKLGGTARDHAAKIATLEPKFIASRLVALRFNGDRVDKAAPADGDRRRGGKKRSEGACDGNDGDC